MIKIWSIINYKGNNYIILKYNSDKTVSITRFSYEPTKDVIERNIDQYYEDVINLEVNPNIPVMNLKQNLIKDVVLEWR